MPNNEYFQSNPTRLDTSRSRMTMHPRWTGSWLTGKLVPIFATSGKNINKDTLTDKEETLLYWWTRASCEELKPAYTHLKIKVEARKRLMKTLNANCGQ